MKNKEFNIDYDESADVLYISLGDSRPGIAVEVNDGEFARIDPYTDELVGITLMYFKEKYLDKEKGKDEY